MKLGEKVTTVGVIIQKWKKYKMNSGSMQDLASIVISPKSKQVDLVNDLKAVGPKYTTSKTLRFIKLKSCCATRSTCSTRHVYRLVLTLQVNI